MDLNALAETLLDLLRADENLTVYDGPAPDLAEPPYVVAYVSNDGQQSDRMVSHTSAANLRIITHSMGANTQAARILSSRVEAALLDVVITAEGLRVHPIRHEYGLPPTTDQSAGSLFVDVVDGWTVRVQRSV